MRQVTYTNIPKQLCVTVGRIYNVLWL